MFCLSIFDLVYVSMAVFTFSLPKFSKAYEESVWYYIVPLSIPILQVSLTGSIYCTMTITLERYLVVCQPFYRMTRNWRPHVFLLSIVILSIIFNTPKFLEIKTCTQNGVFNSNGNITLLKLTKSCSSTLFLQNTSDTQTHSMSTEAYDIINCRGFSRKFLEFSNFRTHKAYQVFSLTSNMLINTLVPFLAMIILNSFIVKKLIETNIPTSNESTTITVDEMQGIFNVTMVL